RCDWSLWQAASQSKRRAYSVGRAVEIRIQERQVIGKDRIYRGTAKDALERDGTERIRLLRERESERRSSALESEDRTRDRRRIFLRPATDVDLQRIRETSGPSLRGNGFEKEFLNECGCKSCRAQAVWTLRDRRNWGLAACHPGLHWRT